MRRRDALKTLGALAGSAYASKLLSACGNSSGAGRIDTIVYMMMENRSYDHYLGSRSLVEGLPGDGLLASMSNPDTNGQDVPVFASGGSDVAQCVANDPPHGWSESRVQFGSGMNDGFVRAHQARHGSGVIEPMSYMLREHVPVTHALADAYTTCDRWFGSMLGPTLPNRMYWHAGTSNGATTNDEVLDGAFNGIPSIYHQLEAAEVEWAYYFGDVPVIAVIEDIPTEGKIRRFNNEFLKDAARGTLPPVCYIDPSFSANDDHPPHHPLLGQQLIAATYQALATSPQWENCLLVITYDENGGFFDHVAPPKAADERASLGFDQLGFRVPTMVIGPYAKQGYVSNVQYDHTSTIKHLANAFALPPLTMRSDNANDLADCIDLERLEAGEPGAPITLPAVEIDETTLPASCSGSSFRTVDYDHDILRWADADRATFAKWDRRSKTRDDIYEISEYLDHHNLGRIKRRR
jgi:phospholipase C